MQEESAFFGWVKSIVVAVIIVVAVRAFLFSPVAVSGESMMPTYEDGDKVLITKWQRDFERFDIIVFKETATENYIKRVIGLPGDQIAYMDDVLYINNQAYEEPYLDVFKSQLQDAGTLTYDFTLEELTNAMTVPDGHVFVLGDNRRFSNDSRNSSVGFVPYDEILGKASLRVYPLNRIELVK